MRDVSDHYYFLHKLAGLWAYGVGVNWTAYYNGEKRIRIALPTYPFEQRHFPANFAHPMQIFRATRMGLNGEVATTMEVAKASPLSYPILEALIAGLSRYDTGYVVVL